jgi:hypothetical protein
MQKSEYTPPKQVERVVNEVCTRAYAHAHAQTQDGFVGVEPTHWFRAVVEERVATFMTLVLYRKVQRTHPHFVTPSYLTR